MQVGYATHQRIGAEWVCSLCSHGTDGVSDPMSNAVWHSERAYKRFSTTTTKTDPRYATEAPTHRGRDTGSW